MCLLLGFSLSQKKNGGSRKYQGSNTCQIVWLVCFSGLCANCVRIEAVQGFSFVSCDFPPIGLIFSECIRIDLLCHRCFDRTDIKSLKLPHRCFLILNHQIRILIHAKCQQIIFV